MSDSDRFFAMIVLAVIFVGATFLSGLAYDTGSVGLTVALAVIAGTSLCGLAIFWMAKRIFL